MKRIWLKRLTAWLLAALLATAPALAEATEPAEIWESQEPAMEAVEAEVSDEGFYDLPAEDEDDGEPEATPTPEPEAAPTSEPEETPTPEPEITPTPEPEATSTPEPEITPTPEPEITPTPEPEETPTPGPEATDTPEPEVTPSVEATEPTDETTGAPTGAPSDTPAGEPSDAPTGEPGDGPTDDPEASPSVDPEASPSAEPDGDPEASPSPATDEEAMAAETSASPSPEVTQAEETPAPKLEAAAPTLTLNRSEVNLAVTEQFALTASLGGAAFASSDPGVAEVDGQGLITARALGTAVVTVTAGEAQAACTVNVLPPPGSVSLSRKKITLGVGQVYTLQGMLPPGTASQFRWKSSKGSVCVVDADGNVTAQGRGTATVTGTAINGKKATCKVVVKPAPTSMSAGLDTAVLAVGMRRTVSVVLNKGAKAGITVTSSDPNVISVENRDLVALNPGAATVTVQTHNGLRQDMSLTVVPAPGSVSFPEGEVLMGKGEKRLLTPIYDNDGTADVTWTSSSPKVVSVSKAGKIKARRTGSAVIALTTHNGLTASCLVRVYKAPSKVKIQPGKKLSLGVGEIYQMSAKLPKGAYSALSWSSSAPGVAAVDPNGYVTALAPGKAKITVRTFNGKKSTCKLTVQAPPSAVAFGVGDQVLGVGQQVDVKPGVNPGAAAKVSLSSDNPGIADTSGSLVTALNPGAATVTATTYNGLTARLSVTVVPAPGSVGFPYSALHLGVGEKFTLQPTVDPGTAAGFTYKSSSKKVATVSAAGVVKAKKTGSATITVTTHNGLKASVKVKVYKAPSKIKLKPASVAMEPGGSYPLTVTLSKGSASTITFTTSNADVVTVDGAGVLYAHNPGTATVTARTYNNKKAACQVSVTNGVGGTGANGNTLTLSSSGLVMMKVGAGWTLAASASSGSTSGIKWETTSSAIAKLSASGDSCNVTAAGPGTAIVTARMPDGASAAVIVMAVDVSDLSASNFHNVQKALLAHEDLINSTQGGNVIWEMIAAKLLKGGYKQANVNAIITTLRAADPTYRNLYIYSFGTYNFVAEASLSGGSNFNTNNNTLYVKSSGLYASLTDYEYVVFHESGHAIDFNADGNGDLNSLNGEAVNALRSDVRNLLNSHMSEAIAKAGVSASAVRTDKVADAMLDYRTLADFAAVRAELGLTDAEVAVYNELKGVVAGDINPTMPQNNGCMVWDAVEGATNFDVQLNFGHSYLVKDTTTYGSTGYTYFYDAQGNPKITTEPWAEFFSSNIMGDSGTISKNLAYLPQTCKYFAETFVPSLMSYFTNRLKNL